MKKLLLSMMLMASIVLVFTSCEKDAEIVQDSMTSTSEDFTTLQSITEDLDQEFDLTMDGFAEGTVDNRSNCVTISLDKPLGEYPNTITLDYGAGCTARNGRELAGKIIIELSDDPKNPGATRTLTFVDFSVDGASVEGTNTWVNNGDAAGYPCFSRTVDKTITFPNGTTVSWNGNHDLCKIEGADTPNRLDDVFEINGSIAGTNRAGFNFAAFITSPLIKPRSCANITSGVVELTRGAKTASVDYGDGNCDRVATVTLPDGTTKDILLKPWWR